MRAELLLSVCLLAAAALVWGVPKFWPQSSTALPSLASADLAGPAAGSVTPVTGSAIPVRRVESPSDQLAIEMLQRSLNQLRTAEPLVAQLDLKINLLEREFRGTGQYCQAGTGLPQVRWDLVLGGQPDGLTLSQIFDGRFFYRLTIQGKNRTLNYVDLYGARDLQVVKTEGVAGLNGWLGVGGLPTMLEQLLATHEFEPPGEPELVKGEDGQTLTLTRIRGRWSKAALRQLLREQIPPETLAGEILWERLPGQMPHGVELVLGSDDYLDAFPYRLAFYQFQGAEGKYAVQPVFELKLHHVEKREAIAPEQFRLSADGLNPVDDTKDYLNRLKLFTLYPLKN
jgi:hypothetical protein